MTSTGAATTTLGRTHYGHPASTFDTESSLLEVEPPRPGSFRRRSCPASASRSHMATPEIVPCKNAVSDASVSTATTMASTAVSGATSSTRKSHKPEASPLKRLRRKRRSSIASESTAFYSSEKTTRSAGASVASFDSQSEALHKHYCYNYRTITSEGQPTTTTTASEQQQQQQHHSFVHPQKETMKRHRRDKTATFGMVGAGVGTLILPVVGTVVGGVLSGYAANQSLKRYEKKMQRKWERDQFQKDASASQTARHAVFV